jgi:DNA-binding transcriptional ArsR family regulator
MKQFVHPAKDDITLSGVLAALADPMRVNIVKALMKKEGCKSCSEAAPCPDMAKSTLSNHFRILREAGLVRTVKKGVENRNTLRLEEIEALFPGLLKLVLNLHDKTS